MSGRARALLVLTVAAAWWGLPPKPVAHAQVHRITRFTVADGLPTNYVYGALEDDAGYMWAYTEHGLARFDGYTWEAIG